MKPAAPSATQLVVEQSASIDCSALLQSVKPCAPEAQSALQLLACVRYDLFAAFTSDVLAPALRSAFIISKLNELTAALKQIVERLKTEMGVSNMANGLLERQLTEFEQSVKTYSTSDFSGVFDRRSYWQRFRNNLKFVAGMGVGMMVVNRLLTIQINVGTKQDAWEHLLSVVGSDAHVRSSIADALLAPHLQPINQAVLLFFGNIYKQTALSRGPNAGALTSALPPFAARARWCHRQVTSNVVAASGGRAGRPRCPLARVWARR